MPIDIAAVAVASFLRPILAKGLETFTDEVGERLGESAANWGAKAKAVWGKLAHALGRDSDQALLTAMKDDEGNKVLEGLVKTRVDETLQADDELRQELADVLAPLVDTPASEFTLIHSGTGDQYVVNLPGADFRKAERPIVAARVETHEAPKPDGGDR